MAWNLPFVKLGFGFEGIKSQTSIVSTQQRHNFIRKLCRFAEISGMPFVVFYRVSTKEKLGNKNIAKLKQKGLLERISPDKGGYWEIKKQQPIKLSTEFAIGR